jgi:glycosyltransferase involved in cell wall biosynthesis
MVGNLSASVVVPYFNNAPLLAKGLPALARQTVPAGDFEVIVVDDGSTDGTAALIASLGLPESFRYVRQENRGAAAARNRGASEARGQILVFLDSDVVPDATLVQEHVESHRWYDRALVVGQTRALPAQGFGVFYEVLGDTVFSFDQGNEEKQITFQQVLSRNLSLRREFFFEIGGFDQDFPRSGFEDVEFAYRAARLGFSLVYNPRASGDHHHTGTLKEVGRHMYNYQISAVLLMQKHPEIQEQILHLRDKEPIRWRHDNLGLVMRKLMRQTLSLRPSVWLMERAISVLERWYPSPSLLRPMYWQVLGSYLFSGFREGLRRHRPAF